MSEHILEAEVTNGRLEITDIPYADGTAVKIVIIPKTEDLLEGLEEIRKLTAHIKGNLSDVISEERDER